MLSRKLLGKKCFVSPVWVFFPLSILVLSFVAYAEEEGGGTTRENAEGGQEALAEQEPPPKPIDPFLMPSDELVKGFRGEARTFAKQWFQKQKFFVAIEFIPGSRGRFWDQGTLVGTMKNGKEISLEISDDFSRDTPGMILDHLRALEYRADISVFDRQDWKKHVTEIRTLQKKIEAANAEFDKRMEKIVRSRLLKHLRDQLSSADRGTVDSARGELEPILKRKVAQQIEDEVKRKFPGANEAKIAAETDKKVKSELDFRVKKVVDDYILDEKLGYDGIQGEARTIIHNFMLKYKQPIIAKVEKDYGPLRKQSMYDVIAKIDEEKARREKAEASIWGRLKKRFQSLKAELMGRLPFRGGKTEAISSGASSPQG